MQTLGVISFLLAIVCMFLIYNNYLEAANIVFGLSLISFAFSLFLSLIEIQLSTKALELELSDMEGLSDPSVIDYIKRRFEKE